MAAWHFFLYCWPLLSRVHVGGMYSITVSAVLAISNTEVKSKVKWINISIYSTILIFRYWVLIHLFPVLYIYFIFFLFIFFINGYIIIGKTKLKENPSVSMLRHYTTGLKY